MPAVLGGSPVQPIHRQYHARGPAASPQAISRIMSSGRFRRTDPPARDFRPCGRPADLCTLHPGGLVMSSAAIVLGTLFGSLINLNKPGNYVHWGFIQMSYGNLIVIILMVIVFLLAIFIPFKSHK